VARIRNIKPEFFKHGLLQDLQAENPSLYPMLVFGALWPQCEYTGVFLWDIRVLKLEILPFLDFDLNKSLEILEKNGFILKFRHKRNEYGYVINFKKYQAISKRELSQNLKYPVPSQEIIDSYMEKMEEPEPSQHHTDTIPEPSQHHTGNLPDPQDLGLRTLDLGQNFTASNEPEKENPPPPEKKPKKPPLLHREPENDLERVNKRWLENYIILFQCEPIEPRWDISSPLITKAIKQYDLEKVLNALNTAMQDSFCLEAGYILKTIMAGNVINRLINAKQQGPPAKKPMTDWGLDMGPPTAARKFDFGDAE
jgi:hypothetical protein